MARRKITEGTRRIDFDSKTRGLLERAAGHRCCLPTCLRPTSGVSRKNGNDCERGVGVAAHVYSAGKNGPRGRGGLTPEQVRSFSNGLWLCATDSRKVDDFQEDYPAEDLLRMKAVRELAHKLEHKDETVGYYVARVGVIAWNECVWEHVAETPVAEISAIDTSSMIKKFESIAVQRLALLANYTITIQPSLPDHFVKKPVAAAAAALVRPVAQTAGTFKICADDVPTRTILFAREKARALDIITALSDALGPGMSGKDTFIIDGTVWLTAADPVTGARYDGGVWQTARLSWGMHYSPKGGEAIRLEVESTFDKGSPFNWTFRAEFISSDCNIDSILRKRRLRISHLRFPEGRSELGRYRELLAKIAAGWRPLAFISLLPHDHGREDQSSLYSHPFEPDLDISAVELAELERDCEKVVAAQNIAAKWAEYWGERRHDFDFNDLFFAEYIDCERIWNAYDALIAIRSLNRTDPLTWRTEPLVFTSQGNAIVLRCRGGALAFERVLFQTARM